MRSIIKTNEQYEAEGKWWFPGKAKRKVPGLFGFDPDSAGSLKLYGSLSLKESDSLFEKFFPKLRNFDAIFGHAIDGTPITLFDCWTKKPSHDAEVIFVNRAIIGVHCRDRARRMFKGVRLRLFNLERWCEHHAFEQPDWTNEKKGEYAVKLKQSSQAEIKGDLPSIDANFKIERWLKKHLNHYDGRCEYCAEIQLQFRKPKSLDHCCEISAKIRNLFTLLTGGPTVAYDFRTISGKNEESTFIASNRQNVREREIWNGQMPCPFDSIKADFAKALDGWFKIYESLDLVITLLFEVLLVRGIVLEERFFNLAQALEGFCAHTIPFEYQSKKEMEKFKAALIAAMPETTDSGLKDRTKSWLKYANNPSLAGYIARLMKPMDATLKVNILGDEWKEGEFIEYVKDTRNIIAHPANGSVWNYTSSERFRDAMDRMKSLLIVVLLQRSGVPLKILQDRYKDVTDWTWG